jgi:hypothetical protein
MAVLPVVARIISQATLSSPIGDIPLCGRKLRMSKCVRRMSLGLDDMGSAECVAAVLGAGVV